MSDWLPNVFEYTDYRSFLRDYYRAAKKNKRKFSYRYLARRAGFSSPNFLKLVIDGKRNLGHDSVERIGDALSLKAEEHQFFANLVAFNQAKTAQDKNRSFARLAANRRFRKARQLDGALFDYLSHWYYPAIRELAGRSDFVEDPEWIAARLVPSVKPFQAAAALEALFRLGLLERDEDNRITRGDPTVTTGHELQSLAVGNYHRQMLKRASESIEEIPPDRRDLSAMTVCINSERVAEAKRRLREFREELMDFCDSDPNPEIVYQINIQVFPMSTRREDEQ